MAAPHQSPRAERDASVEREAGAQRTPRGFGAIVDAYQDRLVRYAFRRLGSIHDAEDVVQGVFVRVYGEWAGDGGIRRIGPYLYRVAANACTDVLRRRKTAGGRTASEGVEQIPADRPDAAELAAAADELRRIDGLLRRLPARQAEVIRFRVFDELSFAEIAEVLDCRPATVKSRFRYGLSKLRRFLKQRPEVPS